jgi:hypothetical protein
MPRDGLTSELRSVPSEVRIAVLKESISAVACGSVQIVDGFAGAVTDPFGTTGEAPGVNGEGVLTSSVEVGSARRVGVAAAWVAGEPHAMRTTADRVRLNTKTRIRLVAIVISSLYYYIPRKKKKTPGHDPGADIKNSRLL